MKKNTLDFLRIQTLYGLQRSRKRKKRVENNLMIIQYVTSALISSTNVMIPLAILFYSTSSFSANLGSVRLAKFVWIFLLHSKCSLVWFCFCFCFQIFNFMHTFSTAKDTIGLSCDFMYRYNEQFKIAELPCVWNDNYTDFQRNANYSEPR